MANLQEILLRSKNKLPIAPPTRKKFNIANNLRPYDDDIVALKEMLSSNKIKHQSSTNRTQARKHSKLDKNQTQTEHKLDTNRTQTEHKPDTNRTQTEHKPDTNRTRTEHEPDANQTQTEHEPDTNRTQTEHEPDTNRTQTEHELDTNRTQTEHKPDTNRTQTEHELDTNRTQTEHKPDTNRTQTEHKPDTNQTRTRFSKVSSSKKSVFLLSTLGVIGNERIIFEYLVSVSQKNGNLHQTRPISKQEISQKCGVCIGSIKTTIQRLIHKDHLKLVVYSRGGRHSTAVYAIPNDSIKKLKSSTYNSNNINTTTIKKEDFKKNNLQMRTQDPLVKDNANKIDSQNDTLPEEWHEIDIEPLKPAGFSKKHLMELYKTGNVTPETAQHSINHFAWGIKNNPDHYAKYKNKIFVLMGKLRKGGVWTESEYESPQEIALKELVEEKRRQKEKQDKLIKELVELEFSNWEQALTVEQKKEIEPKYSSFDRVSLIAILKTHFRQKVLLPRLKQQGLIKSIV